MTLLRLITASLLGLFACAAYAQDDIEPKFEPAPEGVIYPGDAYVEEVIEVEKPVSRSVSQPFAVLRGLDKISGRV